MADVLRARVEVTDTDEVGARGAALLAGVGCGFYSGLDDATARATRLARSHTPRAETVELYDQRFQRYEQVVAQLKAIPQT